MIVTLGSMSQNLLSTILVLSTPSKRFFSRYWVVDSFVVRRVDPALNFHSTFWARSKQTIFSLLKRSKFVRILRPERAVMGGGRKIIMILMRGRRRRRRGVQHGAPEVTCPPPLLLCGVMQSTLARHSLPPSQLPPSNWNFNNKKSIECAMLIIPTLHCYACTWKQYGWDNGGCDDVDSDLQWHSNKINGTLSGLSVKDIIWISKKLVKKEGKSVTHTHTSHHNILD